MHILIRRFAGAFILASLLLAHYHSPYWLWFTAFVGFNLFQSSFTSFCPLELILKKLGVGRDAGSCCAAKPDQPHRANEPNELHRRRAALAAFVLNGCGHKAENGR